MTSFMYIVVRSVLIVGFVISMMMLAIISFTLMVSALKDTIDFLLSFATSPNLTQ